MENNLPSNTIDLLYVEVKQIIEESRNRVYKAANFETVKSYWNIGRKIVEEEQNGKNRADYGTSFSNRNLRHIRQFYTVFPKWNAVRSELSWTHYRLLLKVIDEQERIFYLESSISENWSTRTLERQINSFYYKRILATPKGNQSLIKAEADKQKEEIQPVDFIKDPYVLEFSGLKSNHNFYEQELEQAIINKLQDFLLELGKGFCFVGRQQRISLEHEHFYIDLVFYNYILKCFLLIDLKTGKLTHQDIGQMDTYVRVFEETIKQENDNPTIGLVLCSEKNKALAKYSLLSDSKQIFASKYLTQLPTEEELQKELEKERCQIEIEKKLDK